VAFEENEDETRTWDHISARIRFIPYNCGYMRSRRLARFLFPSLLCLPLVAQQAQPADGTPTFRVAAEALSSHVTVIAYGDQRFHDHVNFMIANPKARVALVEKIAKEKPDAVQMSGDVPFKGTDPSDYDCFRAETKPWRDAQLRVYPALGNHELSGGVEKGVNEWWKAFPELNGMRWYSVALGDRITLIELDSTSDLTSGSRQIAWLRAQLAALPPTVDFVMISLHHPPVADIQTHLHVDHNPRPNEIALRDFLARVTPSMHAAVVVIAGHIHNYERAEVDGITYLVSGGGGAEPYPVIRTSQDLYPDNGFPNFHYVKFELEGDQLKATMIRLADPDAKKLSWQEKDHFVIHKK
jgi:acid phosphatase type 7